jgi:hypothetical protein
MIGISYLKRFLLSKIQGKQKPRAQAIKIQKSSIKQILFVIDCKPGTEQQITESIKHLKKQFSHIVAIVYSKKPTDKILHTLQINPADFSKLFNIRNKELNNVLSNPADLCIVFNPDEISHLHLVALTANASLKIGMDKAGEKYYDILIEMNENPEIMRFLQHVIQLISNLSTDE